jgi:hypothetical protein
MSFVKNWRSQSHTLHTDVNKILSIRYTFIVDWVKFGTRDLKIMLSELLSFLELGAGKGVLFIWP